MAKTHLKKKLKKLSPHEVSAKVNAPPVSVEAKWKRQGGEVKREIVVEADPIKAMIRIAKKRKDYRQLAVLRDLDR